MLMRDGGVDGGTDQETNTGVGEGEGFLKVTKQDCSGLGDLL